MKRPIKAKERETIIQSLKSGVVPRAGLQHIQVGRSEELKSFIKDITPHDKHSLIIIPSLFFTVFILTPS